jgi:hypothetical protein
MAALVAMAKAQLTPLLKPAMLTFSLVTIGIVTYALLLPFSARNLIMQIMARTAVPNAPFNRRMTERLISYLLRVG